MFFNKNKNASEDKSNGVLEIFSQSIADDTQLESFANEKESENTDLKQEGSVEKNAVQTEEVGTSTSELSSVVSVEVTETNTDITNEDKTAAYSLIFKLGTVSYEQMRWFFSEETAEQIRAYAQLDIMGEKSFFFHTKETLEEFAKLSGNRVSELIREALLRDQVDASALETMEEELWILLALEKFSTANKNVQVYDWVSSDNPRRRGASLKIKRLDKDRGSLVPNAAVTVTNKGKRICLVTTILPAFQAYMAGEKRSKYWESIWAYHAWLSKEAMVAKWIKKTKLYVATQEIVAALILPNDSSDVVADLVERMREESIATPVYFTSLEELMKKPLGCWFGSVDGVLKARKK